MLFCPPGPHAATHFQSVTSALAKAATVACGPAKASRPMPAVVRDPVLCLHVFYRPPGLALLHSLSFESVPDGGTGEQIQVAWDVLAFERDVGLAPQSQGPQRPTKQYYLPVHGGEAICGAPPSVCRGHPRPRAPARTGSPGPTPSTASRHLGVPDARPGAGDHGLERNFFGTPFGRHHTRHSTPHCRHVPLP